MSLNQIAFMKGRRVTDNVLLAHELICNYHRKSISPRVVVKIDLMKAFDLVNWSSLLNSLVAMGFPKEYIRWIEVALLPLYSVSINGSLVGYLQR